MAHVVYGVPQTLNTANYVYFLALHDIHQVSHVSPVLLRLLLQQLLPPTYPHPPTHPPTHTLADALGRGQAEGTREV